MKRKKKLFILFLTIILSFCLCSAFIGCSEADDTDKKYDVAIKVGCSDGSEIIFDTNVSEISITRRYDGNSYTYKIRAYQLSDHPEWGDIWFTPSGEGANVFTMTWSYCDMEGEYHPGTRSVQGKGSYNISIHADSSSDLWNYRCCYLKITVT